MAKKKPTAESVLSELKQLDPNEGRKFVAIANADGDNAVARQDMANARYVQFVVRRMGELVSGVFAAWDRAYKERKPKARKEARDDVIVALVDVQGYKPGSTYNLPLVIAANGGKSMPSRKSAEVAYKRRKAKLSAMNGSGT